MNKFQPPIGAPSLQPPLGTNGVCPRIPVVVFSIVILALFLQVTGGIAVSAEQPSIYVVPNGPGWITVNYYHSGTGGVRQYQIERQGGGGVVMYSPNGQWIDVNLRPDTAYTYRACAVFGEGDPACSQWITARTLPPQGRPANLDPPSISNIRVDTESITINWGPTGDYTRVRVYVHDDAGYRNEVEHRGQPFTYGAQTFTGLRPDTNYHFSLKACSFAIIIGESCGPLSSDRVIRTAELEPPPPSRPILKMTQFSHTGGTTTLTLEFSVKLARANAADRFLLYRNNALIKEIMPNPAPGGWAGAYADSMPTGPNVYDQRYHVCFQGNSPRANVCSNGSVALIRPDPVLVDTIKPGPSRAAQAARDIFGNGSSQPAPAPSHPATCKAGFVWRVARPDDLVCVTPASRDRVAQENRTATERVQPGGGAYGPNTCRAGFVWREAFNGDGVCVTPDVRSLVFEENRQGPSRRVQP